MKRQAPPVSRPQKHGTAVSSGTWRTLKSVPGTAMSSHGEESGIVILLLVGIIVVTLHLLEPDLVHDHIDGGRIVPVGKADAERGDRSRHGLSFGLEAVDHEKWLASDHPVVRVGHRSGSILAAAQHL